MEDNSDALDRRLRQRSPSDWRAICAVKEREAAGSGPEGFEYW
jgi:hypothetical protein